MPDNTLYEKNHRHRQEQAFGIALGKIISVDAVNRVCTIATMMGHGSMNDQVVNRVQWLNADANPDGDESGSIPRKGSMGLVFFVNGEAFIWGYFRPQGKGGTAKQGAESPNLVEGDKVISTKAGNRITIKRSGLVELYSKDTLQRLMFPMGSKIVDLCRHYKLKADGGTIEWTPANKITGTLSYNAEFANSVLRAFVIYEQKGFVSSSIISKVTVGAAFPGVPGTKIPTYTHTIGISGQVTTTVSPPLPEGSPSGFKSVMSPDGSLEILAGIGQTFTCKVDTLGALSLSVNKISEATISAKGDIALKNKIGEATISATGEVAIKNKTAEVSMTTAGDMAIKNKLASVSLKSSGDMEIKGPAATITISAAGEIKIDSKTKIAMSSKAGFDIKSMGPVNIEGVGPMNIKNKGLISLDGTGSGATDFVLCNPTTLSPFTGAPLMPFSTTIKVSK